MFNSKFNHAGAIGLPKFSNIRVMMLPIILGQIDTLPNDMTHYKPTVSALFDLTKAEHFGKVGYLTVDEKIVEPGKTHRRAGLHVDGVYKGKGGGWGGGGGWGPKGNGMLTVSSIAGCRAYNQAFNGEIGNEGEAEHLRSQCKNATVFEANEVYWVDGMCVHESMPMTERAARQFVRLSMPSNAPWFEGYTVNPKGIKPSGPVLTRRKFMDM